MPWMVWAILLPLVLAAISFLWPRRAPGLGLVAALSTLAAALAMVRAVWLGGPLRYTVGGWGAPLGIDLYADGLSAVMVLVTAVVGAAVSLYAVGYFGPGTRERAYFWPLWLMLWAALDGLFLSADLFNIYVTLELLGLSAAALTALSGGAAALGAAMRYLLVGLAGSLLYLFGVALLYAGYGTLDLARLGEAVTPAPFTTAALALMGGGLLLKSALFPLHFWLPPAHANAPAPVSALLSGLVVKASFYLLLRFWFVFSPLDTAGAGHLLGVLGAAAILWGSWQALRQRRLKLLVAYSTVAQLGYLFLLFPLAAAGQAAWRAGVYFAVSHAVAKSAMFLSAGTVQRIAGHDRIGELGGVLARHPLAAWAFALAGVSLIGLPPSGGFWAKWLMLEAALAAGQWWWVAVLLVGGLLAAGYVFRALAGLFAPPPEASAGSRPPGQLVQSWGALALALVSVGLGFTGVPLLRLLGGGAGVVP